MASDLISRSALESEFAGPFVQTYKECRQALREAPAVDAIPIDTVAEMMADLFHDGCPCNYNDIDEMIAVDCEKDYCPDYGDHSCWEKYIKAWMERRYENGNAD